MNLISFSELDLKGLSSAFVACKFYSIFYNRLLETSSFCEFN